MNFQRCTKWVGKVGLLLVFTLAGCGGNTPAQPSTASPGTAQPQQTEAAVAQPAQGGIIKVAFESDPSTLDWMSTSSSATKLVAFHMFEQLFSLDANMTEKPMLAQGFTLSEDKKTYTVQLREGVKFHDGSTMTADDVVASIERWSQMSAVGKRMGKLLQSLKALDSHTVELAFQEPYAPLIRNFADPTQALIIIPAKIAKAAGKTPLKGEQLIGTGPFSFDSWKRGQRITLKRFDGYVARDEDWGGLAGKKVAYADAVQYEIVPDAQVRLDGVRTGLYDFASGVPQDLYEQIEASGEMKINQSKPDSWIAVIPEKSKPPFNDLRMRQAINFALDKQKIAQATYGNFFELDGAIFLPEQQNLYSKEGTEQYLAYDPEKAKQLMSEAGYKGEPIRLMATSSYDDHFKTAQVVAQQLQEVGFTVDLQLYEWATLLEKEKNPGAYDLEVQGFSPKYDPTTVPWLYPDFPGKYDSPKAMELLRQWSVTSDPEQMKKLLGAFNRTVYEELPLIKIVNKVGMGVRGNRLQGYGDRHVMSFWNTWVSPAGQ